MAQTADDINFKIEIARQILRNAIGVYNTHSVSEVDLDSGNAKFMLIVLMFRLGARYKIL